MSNRRVQTCLCAVSMAAVLAGCASQDPYQRTKVGAGVGAATGAVIGHQIDHESGKWVGAAVGALAGGAIGNYMDRQQMAFEDEFARERQANQMEVERLRQDTLRITLDSEVSFDFDSAQIKPSFQASLDRLARLIRQYERTDVHIVGHTDSTGSFEYNQRLSAARAGSVADYLASRGVAYSRLSTEGRGESEPRATNATPAGRQLNRRVEIYLRPQPGAGG